MRAALIIYGSLDSVSGGYLYDRRLVQYLRDQGDDVAIISLPWRSYGRHLFDNWSPALDERLQRGGYDVVLQDELNHPSLFRLNERLIERPAPLVSIVHHLRSSEARPSWQNRLYRAIERRYLNTVDAFICNSQTTRQAVASLLDAPRPMLVAPPGRDHIMPQPALRAVAPGDKDDPLRLLFVGNVIPRKGLHVLLEALAHLPTAAWSLAVVGDETIDPAYTASIDRQIARLPAGTQLTRHGRLDDTSLAQQFAAAQLLVVPSSYEGFGIVYMEALGYGLPVIATTAGAAAEIVREGVDGFLINPSDARALAQRLVTLRDNPALLAELSRNALARFQVFPTWPESAGRIRRFLLEQIAQHREEQ